MLCKTCMSTSIPAKITRSSAYIIKLKPNVHVKHTVRPMQNLYFLFLHFSLIFQCSRHISRKVQSANAYWCNKQVIQWFCVSSRIEMHKPYISFCLILMNRYLVIKVKKNAKIRNQYNQVPHIARDTIWESDKKYKETSHTRVPRGQK